MSSKSSYDKAQARKAAATAGEAFAGAMTRLGELFSTAGKRIHMNRVLSAVLDRDVDGAAELIADMGTEVRAEFKAAVEVVLALLDGHAVRVDEVSEQFIVTREAGTP